MANKIVDKLFLYARKAKHRHSFIGLRIRALWTAAAIYTYVVRSYHEDGQEIVIAKRKV